MFLYLRMIFIMVVTLYTSRVVLNVLGEVDFGIHNVVAGVVAMFGFLNSSMSATTQRFISFSLGKGDDKNLSKIFSTCVLTHAIIALLVFALIESVGLWYFYHELNAPADRMDAAFWVFQCAAFSTIITVMSIPFNADIIAHEKMSAFAYITIVEVSLKLLIVFLLGICSIDKLAMYGILLLVVQVGIFMVYMLYCLRHFKESRFKFVFEKTMFKEVSAFAGWNLWGHLAAILFSQGLNLLLNSFFGPVVNAARGLANQVDNAVRLFSTNFQMAMNPQITKTYAAGDLQAMHTLVYRSSRFTYLLLLVLSLPLMIETEPILQLWLGTVPAWTASFVRIMLGVVILDAVANPLMISAAATGKVKVYQSVVGGIQLTIVPIAYVVLKMGGNPNSAFIVHLCVCAVAFVVRFIIIRRLIHLSVINYLTDVFLKCLLVTAISVILPVALYILMPASIINMGIVVIVSMISVITVSYYVGLSSNERRFISDKLRLQLKRHHK